MKKNIEETNYLPIKKNCNIKKLHCMAFSINCAYVIFDNNFMAWIPQTENLYFDSLEYLYKEPIEFNNFGTRKITKIACNNFVIHAVSDDGQVYSWGNDREKNGVLGLGLNYNQASPILNLNFSNKKIIDISLSEKHAAALDINRQLFTWGTGNFGELGIESIRTSNNPIQIDLIKKFFIYKIQCGNNYTAGLDYQGNIFYYGTISTNQDFSKHFLSTPDVEQKHIDNVKSQEIFCGKNVLALIDTSGKVFLFNENEGLIKLRLENRIKTIKFVDNNFYALTTDNRFLYEFTQKRNTDFSLNNYFEYKYNIEEEFVSKIQLLEMPYYVNLLFFMGEFSNKISNYDLKKKIFKGEKNQLRRSRDKDRESTYESILSGEINSNNKTINNLSVHKNSSVDDKKINNNYINNINININNSGCKSLLNNENDNSHLHDNNSNSSVFNHIKIAIEAGESAKIVKPILNLNTGNFLNKNLNKLISENSKKEQNSSMNKIYNTNKNLVLETEPSINKNYPLFKENNSMFKALTPSNKNSTDPIKINNFKHSSQKTSNLFNDRTSNSSKIYANNIRTLSYKANNNINSNLNSTNNNHNNSELTANISVISNATKVNSLVFPPNKSVKSEPLANLNVGKYPEDYKNSVRINRISNLLGKIFNKKLNQIQNQKILQNISQNYPSILSTQQNLNSSESIYSYLNTGKKMYDSLSPNYRKRAEIEKISLDELSNLNKINKRQKSEKSENILSSNNSTNKDYINFDKLKSKYFNKFFGENEEKEIALNTLGNPKSPNEKAISGINLNRIYSTEVNKNNNCYQTVDLSSCSVVKLELNSATKQDNLFRNINIDENNKSKNVIINNIDEFIFSEKLSNSKDEIVNKYDKKLNKEKDLNYLNKELQISRINDDFILNSQDKKNINKAIKGENLIMIDEANFCENGNNSNNQIHKSVNLSILSNIDETKIGKKNSIQKTLNFAYENSNYDNENNQIIQKNISIMDNLSLMEENSLNKDMINENKSKAFNDNYPKSKEESFKNIKVNDSMHELINSFNNTSELSLNYNGENEINSKESQEINLSKKLELNKIQGNNNNNNLSLSNINNYPETHRSDFSKRNYFNDINNPCVNNYSIDTLHNLNILNSSNETGKFPHINYNSTLSPRCEKTVKNEAIKIINEGSEEENPNELSGNQAVCNKNLSKNTQLKNNQNLSNISNGKNNFIDNSANIIIDDQEEFDKEMLADDNLTLVNKNKKITENVLSKNNNKIPEQSFRDNFIQNNNNNNNCQSVQDINNNANSHYLNNNFINHANIAYSEDNIYRNKKKYNSETINNIRKNIDNNNPSNKINTNVEQNRSSPLVYENYPYSNKNSNKNILILENKEDDEDQNLAVERINQSKFNCNLIQLNSHQTAQTKEINNYAIAEQEEKQSNFSECENESDDYEVIDSFNRFNNSLNVISEEESNDLDTLNVNESDDGARLKKSAISKANKENKGKETMKDANIICSNDKGKLQIKDLGFEENNYYNNYYNNDRIDEISNINKDTNNYESNFNSPDMHFKFSNSNLSNSNFNLNKDNEAKNKCEKEIDNIGTSLNNNIHYSENFIYQNKKKPIAIINKNNSNLTNNAYNSNHYENKNNLNNIFNQNNNKTSDNLMIKPTILLDNLNNDLNENMIVGNNSDQKNYHEDKFKNIQKKENNKDKIIGIIESNKDEERLNRDLDKETFEVEKNFLNSNINKPDKKPIGILMTNDINNPLNILQKIGHDNNQELQSRPIRGSSIKITSIERSRSKDRRGANDINLNRNNNTKESKDNIKIKLDNQSEKLINKIINSPNIKIIKKDQIDNENNKSFSDIKKNENGSDEKDSIINLNKYKRKIVSDIKLNENKSKPTMILTNKKVQTINSINNEKLDKFNFCIKKILFRDFIESTFEYIQSIKNLFLNALKKEEFSDLIEKESNKNSSDNVDNKNVNELNNIDKKSKINIKDSKIKSNISNMDNALESSPVSTRNYQDTIDIETSLIKQIFEPSNRTNKITSNNSLEKKSNEKYELSLINQDNFIISKITEFAIENQTNSGYNKYNAEEIQNNFADKNNSKENFNLNNPNNNVNSNSNFNSISFIEVYSNSISKYSNNNSEIFQQNESTLFVIEKQVYLQLNAIRPIKKTNTDFLSGNENEKNYISNFNNFDKSELENITEYIDLENMSSLSKSRISNDNLISNINSLDNTNKNNVNRNSSDNLNYSSNDKENYLSKSCYEFNKNNNNKTKKDKTNKINNFDNSYHSLLINNSNTNFKVSDYQTKSESMVEPEFTPIANNENINNQSETFNEEDKKYPANSLRGINEENNNYESLNSPDINKIKSLSDRLEKLKKAKAHLLEKSKKINEEKIQSVQNSETSKNLNSMSNEEQLLESNIIKEEENNNGDIKHARQNYDNDNNNNQLNNQNITFDSEKDIHFTSQLKNSDNYNFNQNYKSCKSNLDLDKKSSNNFIKIVDDENIQKSLSDSSSAIEQSVAQPKNSTPSKAESNNNQTLNSSPKGKTDKFNFNSADLVYNNKNPIKVKSMPSTETKKQKTKIFLNEANQIDNCDLIDNSYYKPHHTTANYFHLSSSNEKYLEDFSLNEKNDYKNYDTLNYSYTKSSELDSFNIGANENNNNNFNDNLIKTAEKAKRIFSPINDSNKNIKKLLTTEKKRNSEVKIIKSIKKDSFVKNFYSNNNQNAPVNTQTNTTTNNTNRNLSARKTKRINASNINLNQKNLLSINVNNINNSTIAIDKNDVKSNNNYSNPENKLKIYKSNPNFSNVKISNIIKKIKSRPSDDVNYNTFNQTTNTINNFNVTCFDETRRISTMNNNNTNLNNTISGNENFLESENINIYNNYTSNNSRIRTSKSGNKSKPNFPLYKNVIKSKNDTENINSNNNTIQNYPSNAFGSTDNINDLYLNTERNSPNKIRRIPNIITSGTLHSKEKIINKNCSKSNINIEEEVLVNQSNELESNFISDDGTENISCSNQSDSNQNLNKDSSKANSVNSNPNVIMGNKNITYNNNANTKGSNNKILSVKVNSQTSINRDNEGKTWSNIKVKKEKSDIKINYIITPNYTQNNPVIISNAEKGRITNSKEKVKYEALNTTAGKNATNNFINKNEVNSSAKNLANLSNTNFSGIKPNHSLNKNNNNNNVNRNLNEILNNINPSKAANNNVDYENNLESDKASNKSSNLNSINSNVILNKQQDNKNTNIDYNNFNPKNNPNLRNINTSSLINNINQKKSNLKNPNSQIQFLNTTNKNPIQVKFNNFSQNSNRKEILDNSKIKNSLNNSKAINPNNSTSSLVLDKCIENLKLALDNYIKASRTDKDMLKNIIRDNLSNIKKENELQKSLHRECLKNEAENNINFSINSNQSRFDDNNSYSLNINSNSNDIYNNAPLKSDINAEENSLMRKLISEEFTNRNNNNISENAINSKDENNEVFDENEFNKLSDDPDDIKDFIINQLESFKLGLVKDRLEKYFEKLRDGSCTPRSLCSSPMRHLIELDEENRDKQSEYEPIELDRSQMTQMSLNGSLRKSLSNASSYYQDLSSNINVNAFNFPSSNSLRGRYGSFNELTNLKVSNNFEINSQKDLKSCNQRNAEELYEIAENSAEITDIASSRIDSNFSTLNNLKETLENNNNNNMNIINNDKLENINNNSSININNSNILINLSSQQISLINSESEIESLTNEKKRDTYDTLFNSLPNSDNFNYKFEDFNEKNTENYNHNFVNNLKNLNQNDLNDKNISEIDNDLNYNDNKKAVKTVDVLTKEFMNRKLRNNVMNKKELKDPKLNNLRKIMQSQKKNNY